FCAAGERGASSPRCTFNIGETEKKCFIEEIPDETMIIGNYRTQLYDKQREEYLPATQGLGMFVEVKDPDTRCFVFSLQVILSRQYEHQICLHSNSSKFSLFAGGMLYREERFRQTSESTNQRVLWWSIMRHLKSFFEAKKLV
uniref:Transmembrane p24 trafficking protein 9 n=1 Tax=Maylandia zebra TaxID=106582 RepID=A0A3P9CEJ0_9CICH